MCINHFQKTELIHYIEYTVRSLLTKISTFLWCTFGTFLLLIETSTTNEYYLRNKCDYSPYIVLFLLQTLETDKLNAAGTF